MRSIIFDTETTGLPKHGAPLSQQPKIIELGAIIFEDGKEVSTYNQLINPGEAITEEITKITGLTNDDIKGMPSFLACWGGVQHIEDGSPGGDDIVNQIVPSFRDLLAECDQLIAHNAEFDTKLLRFELERMGMTPDEAKAVLPKVVLCTVEEFRHLFGRRAKMTELYKKVTGKELFQTHRALDDCRALAEICVTAGMPL